MTTTGSKGSEGIISSYPSRQRKLGPAPFASFEDLADEIERMPEEYKNRMPEIKEDATTPTPTSSDCSSTRAPETQSGAPSSHQHSPSESEAINYGSSSGQSSFKGGGTGTSNNDYKSGNRLPAPTSLPTSSGPTSGLQTPSTPRIDISCASSGTPPSEGSSSAERELFQGGLGLAFQEEGTEDLRSSTEELDFGEDDLQEESSKKKKEELRRASHTASFPSTRKSFSERVTPESDELLGTGAPTASAIRKPSTHSLHLEGFYSKCTRHGSFGAGDFPVVRPLSSLSASSNFSGRRSSSPHKMLLETSFCGNKPIPTPSMDLDSPPQPSLTTSDLDKRSTSTTSTPRSKRNFYVGSSYEREPSDDNSTVLTTAAQVYDHAPSPPTSPPSAQTTSGVRGSSNPSAGPWPNKNLPNSQPPPPPDSGTSSTTTTPPGTGTPSSSKATRDLILKESSRRDSGSGSNTFENEEITTELKIVEGAVVTVDDAPLEAERLFANQGSQEEAEGDDDDDDEDQDELPYVPTSLPLEKSVVVPIVPVKERRKDSWGNVSASVSRPRVVRSPNPASLKDYIVNHTAAPSKELTSDEKIKINLPREDSLPRQSGSGDNRPRSPKKKLSQNWDDFAELGLRSPREIRRKMKEENGKSSFDQD